jgi:hypothetical protein
MVAAGRRMGSITPGPPSRLTAAPYLAVLESVAIEVAGKASHAYELSRGLSDPPAEIV